MNKEIEIKKNDSELMLQDLENTKKMCEMLLQHKHYNKMGPEAIYAIVEKAKSLGIRPLEALNGGCYFVQGKVEMTASMMSQLIRKAGHSITKDKKSDDTICILHGKRKDTNDTWSESFSIEDAKKAQIYRNQWLKYPKDMLYARALSRLARQLFSDVIAGCYVEGELQQAKEVEEMEEADVQSVSNSSHPDFVEISHETITEEQVKTLEDLLIGDEELYDKFIDLLQNKFGYATLKIAPASMYPKMYERAKRSWEERNSKVIDVDQEEVEYEAE